MVIKTNFLSFSVLVSAIVTFMSKKKSFLWISPKMLQNNRKPLIRSMWLTLWRKTVFVNIYPLLLVWWKTVVKTYPNFPQDLPLSNIVRKTSFLSILVLVSEIVTFLSKEKILYEYPPKCFKTTERNSLAVCGLICGEKKFLLNIYSFNWFD